MHENEDIGGWDTVLRREEYNELYANQQATLSLQSAVLSFVEETDAEVPKVEKKSVETKTIEALGHNRVTVQYAVQKPKEEIKIPVVNVGDRVQHKSFGEITISLIDKEKKHIWVKFVIGEKPFVFPDAFIHGHLSL